MFKFATLLGLGLTLMPLALRADEPSPALTGGEVPDTALITATYICDRGVEVPATYLNTADRNFVVINVEGRQISLEVEVSASGARYGWPSDGAHYVWWNTGDEATLYWSEAGAETAVLEGCKEKS